MNLNSILNSNIDPIQSKKAAGKGVSNGELGEALNSGQNKNEFLQLLNSSMDHNQELAIQKNPMKGAMLQSELKAQSPESPFAMNQDSQFHSQMMSTGKMPTINSEIPQLKSNNQMKMENLKTEVGSESGLVENIDPNLVQNIAAKKNAKSNLNQILFNKNNQATQPQVETKSIFQNTPQARQLAMMEQSQLATAKGAIQVQTLGNQDTVQQFNSVQANPDLERINLKNALSQKNNNLNVQHSYFDKAPMNKSSMGKVEDKYKHNSIFPKRGPVDENGQLLKNDFLEKENKLMSNEQAGIDKALTSNMSEQARYIPTEPLLNRETAEATPRTLDFKNINLDTNTDKIIDQISSYIVRNKVEANPTMSVRVNHDDLGMIDIQIEKFQDNLNIKIGADNINGKLFFDQNSTSLMDHLRTSGIKLGNFNIDWSQNSDKDFSQSNRDFSQNFGGNSRQQGGQGFQSRQDDSQRRQELWNNYLEQREAA